MAAELGVARRLVLLVREIAIGRRESVGAMLARHATQLPKRLLHTFGERGEALAAADRLDVLPAAEGEPEVIEQMREWRASDSHLKHAAIGEIRERLSAGRVLLAEDELALGSLGRPPMRDPPLQGAQQPIGITAGMTALQLAQDRRRAQMRDSLQHRHDLLTPDLDEGVVPRSIAPRSIPLAWQDRSCVDAPAGTLAESGAGRSSALVVSVLA